MIPEPLPVNIDPMPACLKLGHEFTIAGIKALPNGRFLTDCKPGDETVFTASLTPSIYRLTAK